MSEMRRLYPFRLKMTVITAMLGLILAMPSRILAQQPPCNRAGWFPQHILLKDHSVFRFQGSYYLASIYITSDHVEDRFAYARSPDLCEWDNLEPILRERPAGSWDDYRIWAPFVLQENGTYYMFYTGVTEDFTQSIMLATSTDPADPDSWRREGMILQPDHPGTQWAGPGYWSDARDPTVLKGETKYYLYYTARDVAGGIVGLATAPEPAGPWQDWGATLTLPTAMPESPTIVHHDDWYYLIYNRVIDGTGPEMRVGPTPSGPWSNPRPLAPGWAHEFWPTPENTLMTSYLTSYDVTIREVTWDTAASPAWPFIGSSVWHTWQPIQIK